MGITEIVLLILGIVIFVASFIIPERKKKLQEGDVKLGEIRIKQMLDEQLGEVEDKVSDAVEGAISYALEKTERAMERLSNEKIMAINEYSDTVLESIHKNHEETVFLYDMLNDKYESLKDFAFEVDKKAKEVKETARESVKVVEESAHAVQASVKAVIQPETTEDRALPEIPVMEEAPLDKESDIPLPEDTAFFSGVAIEEEEPVPGEESGEEPQKRDEAEPEPVSPFMPLQPERVQGTAINDKKPEEEAAKGKTRKKAPKKQVKLSEVIQEKQADIPAVNLSFANTAGGSRNNKEKILELYKEGKSNVAIAKELGLGIGEVKLIIDLFRGV